MTIKKKMIILISSMLMVVVLMSIVFIYYESSKILKNESEHYIESQLDRAFENINFLLKTITLETEKLSLDNKVIACLSGDNSIDETNYYLKSLLSEKNEKDQFYFDLFLINNDGIIISSAMDEALGLNVNNRMYFRKAKEQKMTNTSDVIYSRADKTQIVITIGPTYNNKNEIVGYTGVAIYAKYFSNFLKNFNIYEDSGYVIVDSFDRIIAHPDKEKISFKFDYFGMDKNNIKKTNNIIYKGEVYKILQKKIKYNNWRIFSYLKYNDIYSKSMELAYSFMKIAFIAIFMAIGFGIYLTDFISRPIITMTESINKILLNEENFKHKMLDQFHNSLVEFEQENDIKNIGIELKEVNNFKKAIIGFKEILKESAQNLEIEYNKLNHYIESLYKELDNVNKRNLEFIATLSHDIRTPLTLIKGYARGLESGDIKDENMKKKFQKGIVKSVDNIEHLIYNVLDFAYEVDKVDSFEFYIYSIEEVVEEILFELKQLYKNEYSRINIKIDINNYLDKKVKVDLMNINRVIINLVNNSMKYTQNSDVINLNIIASECSLDFEIYDEGRGIAKEELDKIFDLFYRSENSKNIKGYGLGLYISYQILKVHNSKLKCESEKDKFTSMKFSILYE